MSEYVGKPKKVLLCLTLYFLGFFGLKNAVNLFEDLVCRNLDLFIKDVVDLFFKESSNRLPDRFFLVREVFEFPVEAERQRLEGLVNFLFDGKLNHQDE